QAERRLEHALEVRVAYADVVHVRERLADVVDVRPALADSLRDEPRSSMEVELAHIRRMVRVRDEGERLHAAAARQCHRDEARLVHTARHLAVPEACERAAYLRARNAK